MSFSTLPLTKDCIPILSFVQPTIQPLILPTQESTDESNADFNSKSLPIIFDEDVKKNVSEQVANQKLDTVVKQKNRMRKLILGEQQDVVGFRIGVQIITFFLFLTYVCFSVIIHLFLQKISFKI